MNTRLLVMVAQRLAVAVVGRVGSVQSDSQVASPAVEVAEVMAQGSPAALGLPGWW